MTECKRFLITGGAGFIGSNLVDKLLELGHEVVVVDNLSSGFQEYLPQHEKLRFLKLDVSDWEQLNQYRDYFLGVDTVYNLSACARIQPAILNPKLAHDNNVTGMFNVLELMRLNSIKKIVFSSSSSIYGLKNQCPLQEDVLNDCLNPYSVSKFIGEQYIKTWCKLYGIKGISTRFFNIWGKREVLSGTYAPVVGIFFRQILQEKRPVTIVGSGNQSRDFTNIRDCCDALVKCSDVAEQHEGTVMNIGTGRSYTVNELADMILDVCGKPQSYRVHVPERPGEAWQTQADITLAKKCLDWEPKVSLENEMENHKNYYMKLFGV